MLLREGLALYHGSYMEVAAPDLARCARYKDFGRGFYLTTSAEQARSFARLSTGKAADRGLCDVGQSFGVLNRFVVTGMGLRSPRVLEFVTADSDWLACVAAHRMRGLLPDVVRDLQHYDVIIGKIANDQTNVTINAYMDEVYGVIGSDEAVSTCIRRLLPERLKDQLCFRSPAALACLAFEGSEKVWV